jgi:hypothetical protein
LAVLGSLSAPQDGSKNDGGQGTCDISLYIIIIYR